MDNESRDAWGYLNKLADGKSTGNYTRSLSPSWSTLWTVERAESELISFTFVGPGWYNHNGDWLLVLEAGTLLTAPSPQSGGERCYLFMAFNGFDPRELYRTVAEMPVVSDISLVVTRSARRVSECDAVYHRTYDDVLNSVFAEWPGAIITFHSPGRWLYSAATISGSHTQQEVGDAWLHSILPGWWLKLLSNRK